MSESKRLSKKHQSVLDIRADCYTDAAAISVLMDAYHLRHSEASDLLKEARREDARIARAEAIATGHA